MGWGIPCDARRLYVVLLQRFRVDAVGITNAKRRVSFVVLLVIGALEDHDAWNRFVGDGSLELGGAAHGPATHAHRSLNLAAMLNIMHHYVRCLNEREQNMERECLVPKLKHSTSRGATHRDTRAANTGLTVDTYWVSV